MINSNAIRRGSTPLVFAVLAIGVLAGCRDTPADPGASTSPGARPTSDVPAASVESGKSRLTISGDDLGVSDDTFAPCSRTDETSASATAKFDDGTVMGFSISGGQLFVFDVLNAETGFKPQISISDATVEFDGDIVTISGELLNADGNGKLIALANCPLGR